MENNNSRTPETGQEVNGHSWENILSTDNSRVNDTDDLVDIPMLASLTESNLRSVSQGSKVNSQFGGDIIFFGANNAQFNNKIELYAPNKGAYITSKHVVRSLRTRM